MAYDDHHHHLDPAAVDFRAFYPYTPNEVKHRKRTTSTQLKVLEAIFKKDTKPNNALRQELALQLDMTPRGVQVWFQNRRAKEKVKKGNKTTTKGAAGSNSLEGLKEEDSALAIKDETDEGTVQNEDDDELPDDLDAYSQSPPNTTSPPQLHLITDATKFSWQDSPVEPPPDSATFPIRPPTNPFLSNSRRALGNDPYHRRGSLPATAFPQPDSALQSPMVDSFDPLLRRSSVDASLQRLASNPFASLARAKNTALYGPGFGVAAPGSGTALRHSNQHHYHHQQLNRLPYSYPQTAAAQHHQRRGLSSSNFATMPQYGGNNSTRRLSMDSRQTRLAAMGRTQQSPSPSPLTPYDAVIRASLPDHTLYAMSSRVVASPIPGPLPSPGFSFGAASTPPMASPSSGDSERNSPDSLRSFPFRSEEHDEDGGAYDAYSRFGSIASIATSESSINSAYYAEIGGPEHSLADDRRDSCASQNHFLGLLSELEVSHHQQPELHSAAAMGLVSYSPAREEYGFVNTGKDLIGVPQPNQEMGAQQQQQQQQQQVQQQQHVDGSYPSPASTISPRDAQSPHGRSQSTPVSNMPISTSSELEFALEGKPDQQKVARQEQQQQQQYLTYGGNGPAEQDNNAAFYNNNGTVQVQQETHVQQQQQEPAYNSTGYSSLAEAYPSDVGLQQNHQQQQLDFLPVYNPAGAYADALTASVVAAVGMDNGMQNVDGFAAYA